MFGNCGGKALALNRVSRVEVSEGSKGSLTNIYRESLVGESGDVPASGTGNRRKPVLQDGSAVVQREMYVG